MVAYRRPKNLKETLIRAKVPPEYTRPKRRGQGMKRCPYDCNTCPYAQLGSKVKAARSDYIHEIVGHMDCQTDNLVYCISCNKCEEQYVGQTEKTLAVRFSQHQGYARNGKLDKATGHHFNLPGHSLANMKVTILEKIASNLPQMRNTRESYYIKKFNTKNKGMDRKSWPLLIVFYFLNNKLVNSLWPRLNPKFSYWYWRIIDSNSLFCHS